MLFMIILLYEEYLGKGGILRLVTCSSRNLIYAGFIYLWYKIITGLSKHLKYILINRLYSLNIIYIFSCKVALARQEAFS